MQLVPDIVFKPIFDPLQNQRIGVLFSPGGNNGDRLIELATMQLLGRFGIEYTLLDNTPWKQLDVILCGGGGNFGHPYCLQETLTRRRALNSGCKCILLPQTAYGTEWGWHHHRTFFRDRQSLIFHPGGILAPDLTFGLACSDKFPEPTTVLGRFFSTSPESLFLTLPNEGDPRHVQLTQPIEYITIASRYAHIVTDCLHFAIAGLIAQRRVTLIPTRLHKQRSTWESWLRDLGCEWANHPDKVES